MLRSCARCGASLCRSDGLLTTRQESRPELSASILQAFLRTEAGMDVRPTGRRCSSGATSGQLVCLCCPGAGALDQVIQVRILERQLTVCAVAGPCSLRPCAPTDIVGACGASDSHRSPNHSHAWRLRAQLDAALRDPPVRRRVSSHARTSLTWYRGVFRPSSIHGTPNLCT